MMLITFSVTRTLACWDGLESVPLRVKAHGTATNLNQSNP
jgi:hypothetical protein